MRQDSRVEGGGQVALAPPLAVARTAPRERPALNDTRRPRAAGARRADDGVAVVHGVAELRAPGQPAAEVVLQFAHDRVAVGLLDVHVAEAVPVRPARAVRRLAVGQGQAVVRNIVFFEMHIELGQNRTRAPAEGETRSPATTRLYPKTALE